MLLMAADALVILDFQELTENSLSMWDTARPWAPQRLVQDNKTLVSRQVGLCYSFLRLIIFLFSASRFGRIPLPSVKVGMR